MSPADARRQPFDALPHASWPDIAAVLSGVWPKAAAEHDLRWYAAEHAIRSAKLPSVRDLAARWGWTRSRAYDLLTNEAAWRDASRPWSWREADSSGDADIRTPAGQSPDSLRTASGQPERLEAGNPAQSGQHPDTGRTVAGHDPDSRAFLVGSPNTQHPAPGDQPQGVEAPPEREITNPEKWAGLFTTPPPEAAPPTKPPPIKDRLDLAIRTVYEAYRLTHPRKSPTISPGDRKAIKAMLDECGGTTAAAIDEATQNAVAVLEWVEQSQDERAQQVRGKAPWPGGRFQSYLDLDSLSRKAGSRLEMAIAWRDRGRRDEPPPLRHAAPPRPNASTPFVSIADMIAGLHQTSQPPPRTGVVIDIEEPN